MASIDRVPLGSTGLMVPPIAVGCAEIGSMPEAFAYAVSEDDALATIRAALDSPLNYIDTAALYGDGESERRVGLVLRERGGLPAGAILETKAGRDPRDNNYRRETVQRRFERSLELLGVDKVHACFLHDAEWAPFAELTAPGGVVELLLDYKRQGVIGALGVAAGPVDLSMQYVQTGLFDLLITHNRYSLLNRTANAVQIEAKRRGMGVLNAAPYGSGMLAKGPDAYPRYAYMTAPAAMIETTRVIADICAKYDVPLAAAALQFSMLDPNVDVTIVGMSKAERIPQTIALATAEIPQALWDELSGLPTFDTDPEAGRFSDLASSS
ncbi:MAG TPA: aldo/keto reductase [Thermomicrobiales bacterium]|nr:aldo/keto reductase [Thermomicrobiales bacterium]